MPHSQFTALWTERGSCGRLEKLFWFKASWDRCTLCCCNGKMEGVELERYTSCSQKSDAGVQESRRGAEWGWEPLGLHLDAALNGPGWDEALRKCPSIYLSERHFSTSWGAKVGFCCWYSKRLMADGTRTETGLFKTLSWKWIFGK